MSPEYSKIVAYASQHTDDAKHEHALEFENGGRFQQVLSAHKFFDLDTFSLDSQYKIYLPFHFIPGIQGTRFQELLVCRQNSETSQRMVREVSRLKDKPYLLHRLGIAVHVYADTWSHQSFSGLKTDLNDISDIDVMNENRGSIATIFMDFFRNVKEAVIPQIGHAEATYLPDEPYREWSFFHNYENETKVRKNWVLCLDASRSIYNEIKRFLNQSNHPDYKTDNVVSWGAIKPAFSRLFKDKGTIEKRCENWSREINISGFGFPCQDFERDIVYEDREWFKEAVGVTTNDDNEERYERKNNFHESNWKLFHDAAASHRFFILQELLPPNEIICG
jgi:hypothetical protein